MENKKIYKIVLTGGPCAGKTTILKELERDLLNKGYYVITVAETATELIKSKIMPGKNKKEVLLFQDLLLKQQVVKEIVVEHYAKELNINKPIIILYDRAIIDNCAYLDSYSDFKNILKNNNLNELEVLTKYDLVIDLLSMASFMPDKYELDEVRFENFDEAKKIDWKTSTAWIHHPNIRIISPKDDLKIKIDEVLSKVSDFINGYNYYNTQVDELTDESNLLVYNEDNCRITDVYDLYLSDNLILRRIKNDKESVCLLMKADKEEYYKVISEDEAINLMCNHCIVLAETRREINFIKDGAHYKIVQIDGKNYVKYEKIDNLPLPLNLCIKEYGFQKKYGNIK